jgi:hypothetical protein
VNALFGALLLATQLQSVPMVRDRETRVEPVCGLALRRVSPSPAPVESGVLLSFSEASSPRPVAIKLNRLTWFEPADDLEHELAIRFADGNQMTAGRAARGHALAFLCATRGPFQVECLTHGRVLFTGFILAGDWVTVCVRDGCRFSVLPDGDYSSVFWPAVGRRQSGPTIHVRGRNLTPGVINGYLLKVDEGEVDLQGSVSVPR